MKKEKSQLTDRITIPPEAVKAAATAIFDASPFREQAGGLHEQSEQYQTLTRVYARAAIRAALNAWPGMHWVGNFGLHLPLPLPHEARDE